MPSEGENSCERECRLSSSPQFRKNFTTFHIKVKLNTLQGEKEYSHLLLFFHLFSVSNCIFLPVVSENIIILFSLTNRWGWIKNYCHNGGEFFLYFEKILAPQEKIQKKKTRTVFEKILCKTGKCASGDDGNECGKEVFDRDGE